VLVEELGVMRCGAVRGRFDGFMKKRSASHATLLETYLLLSDNGDPAARARARKAVIAADHPRAGRPRHAELLAHPVRVDPDRLADILEAERPRAIRARDVGACLLVRVPAGRAPRGSPNVVQDRLEHGRH
jgi:hypothetical protein